MHTTYGHLTQFLCSFSAVVLYAAGAITVGVAVLYALWKYEIISRFLFWLQDLPPTTGLIIYIPAFMFVSLPIGCVPLRIGVVCVQEHKRLRASSRRFSGSLQGKSRRAAPQNAANTILHSKTEGNETKEGKRVTSCASRR